jgi:hypothetical protein
MRLGKERHAAAGTLAIDQAVAHVDGEALEGAAGQIGQIGPETA